MTLAYTQQEQTCRRTSADDLVKNRVGFGQAFADTAERLVVRFGGEVLERFTDGPTSPTGESS